MCAPCDCNQLCNAEWMLAHIICGVESQRDAALVGDDDDAQARAVEASDGLRDAGQRLKLAPGGDVAAFRHLAIEDAVAVQEDGAQGAEWKAVCGVGHPVMIAIALSAPSGARNEF